MATRRLRQRHQIKCEAPIAVYVGVCLGLSSLVRCAAEGFVINTPGGPATVQIGHLNAGGTVLAPESPTAPDFRPPSIFSAPLPTGAGARALGLGGAFTAVADDATAASWNPAGLIQLEKPEVALMLRASRSINSTSSSDPDYQTGRNAFDAFGLNYASLALPFQLAGHNFVFSANLQEAYDFTQQFSAKALSRSQQTIRESSAANASGTTVQQVEQPSSVFAEQNGTIDISVTSQLTTHQQTTLNQLLSSQAVTDINFSQEGIIHSYGPALAIEITPKVAVGFAFNVFQDRTTIQSQTRAIYQATSQSLASLATATTTSGSYTYSGVIHLPPGGMVPIPIDIPISGAGNYTPFTDTTVSSPEAGAFYQGAYDEVNQFRNLYGFNGTLGGLWTVSRKLTFGFSLDLPWTAHAQQTRTINNTVTAYSADGSRVLNQASYRTTQTKDIEIDFPLYWALGGVWRWSDVSYTSLDVSQTLWSSFSYQAEGDERMNPLDGSAYGSSTIGDCWSVRLGHEYLITLKSTAIPLRAGLLWEQRPAVGAPDNYWGFSVGTGISIGRVVIDVAYVYKWGNDVLGSLVSGQSGLRTDAQEHALYLSCIYHF